MQDIIDHLCNTIMDDCENADHEDERCYCNAKIDGVMLVMNYLYEHPELLEKFK